MLCKISELFNCSVDRILDIDKEFMTLSTNQYHDMISSAEEIAAIAHERDSFAKDFLKEKRNRIIEILRRSSEQEELALTYLQKATASVRK